MATRFYTALILSLALVPMAAAQTVRFDTNVGNIDLILNPMGLPELRGHVDNMLAYVDAGRYEHVVLNRADTGGDPNNPADDFVLQFGGFLLEEQVFSSFNDFQPVEAFDPVIVDFDGDITVDFDTSDLTNTRGQVSLALGNFPGTNTTNPNSGTSSFFVSLGDTSFLDASGFVPFAKVADMSTVDYIMRLNQVSDPSAGLASSNIPVLNDDNLLVFVERAFVVDPDPVVPVAAISALSEGLSDLGTIPSESAIPAASLQTTSVPEPPALVLVVGALLVLTVLKGPRV